MKTQAELEAEAKESAKHMIAKDKTTEEIVEATGLNAQVVGGLRTWIIGDDGKAWLKVNGYAEPGADENPDEEKKKAEEEAAAKKAAEGGGTVIRKDGTKLDEDEERLKEYQPQTENAKLLYSTLMLASGINKEKLKRVVFTYEGRQAEIDANPFLLYDILDLAGISRERNGDVLRSWAVQTKNRWAGVFGIFSTNPDLAEKLGAFKPSGEGDPIDELVKFMTSMKKLKLLSSGKFLGDDDGEEDMSDSLARRLDKMEERMDHKSVEDMFEKLSTKIAELEKGGRPERSERPEPTFIEKAQDAVLVRKMFFDEGGRNPQSTVEVVEEEPILDENGKQKIDADGMPSVKRRVFYQPVQTTAVHRKEPDELDEMMEKMTKIAMVKMITGGGPGMGGVMGGMGQMNPFMAPLMRPMLNDKNELIYDKYGQPQMEITGYATLGGTLGGQGEGTKTSDLIEGMKVVAEITKPRDSSESKIVDVLLAQLSKRDDQAMANLQQQIRELQGGDPLQYAVEMVTKLKDLGVVGGEKTPESLEALKLDIDFKKYAQEHNDTLTQWIWQQREKQNDQKFAREQMRELSNTIKEGIDKVAKPLAESFGKGFEHGAVARNAANPQRPGPQQAPPAEQDIKSMSQEELTEYLARANQAQSVVETAKKNVIAELQARGVQV